mmetsp:Transcript_17560/g.53552  ORF Transcript_17560/g.53552 Transcript_17560/m.53552 type:complete len:219 (+) Transcript_17560:299-955(+)
MNRTNGLDAGDSPSKHTCSRNSSWSSPRGRSLPRRNGSSSKWTSRRSSTELPTSSASWVSSSSTSRAASASSPTRTSRSSCSSRWRRSWSSRSVSVTRGRPGDASRRGLRTRRCCSPTSFFQASRQPSSPTSAVSALSAEATRATCKSSPPSSRSSARARATASGARTWRSRSSCGPSAQPWPWPCCSSRTEPSSTRTYGKKTFPVLVASHRRGGATR